MNTKRFSEVNVKSALMVLGLSLAWICSNPAVGNAQPPPPNLPAQAEDAVRLTRAGVGETVILSKIRNDGVSCNLNSDQIIYLNGQGVSQNVISALMQGGNATAGVVATPTPAPAVP